MDSKRNEKLSIRFHSGKQIKLLQELLKYTRGSRITFIYHGTSDSQAKRERQVIFKIHSDDNIECQIKVKPSTYTITKSFDHNFRVTLDATLFIFSIQLIN